MPTTPVGRREELRKNLPMDEVEALGEVLVQALFDVDEEKVDTICNAFLRQIGLRKDFQCKFTPKRLRWDHWIVIELEVTLDGKEHFHKWQTDYYYTHRPPLADDKNRASMLLNDVLLGVEYFLLKLFQEFMWGDADRRRLYGDAIFKMGKMEI